MATCRDCPSFMDDNSAITARFGRPLGGVPICGRYGIPLGTPQSTGQDMQNIAVFFAEQCDAYGMPISESPVEIRPKIANPDTAILEAGPSGQQVKSCKQCENCVSDNVMLANVGIPLPLCSAKGTLIFRPISEAKNCPWALPGYPRQSFNSNSLWDVYRPGFKFEKKVHFSALVKNSWDGEPQTFESDYPVSAEDRAEGIRAWRKVEPPHGFPGEPVSLPVFDIDSYTEEERELIPVTDDHTHPELYIDYSNLLYRFAVDSYMLDETVVLTGRPGLGKTQFARYLAWLCVMPFRRLQFNQEMDVDDVLGSMQYSPERGTYFEPGELPLAWEARDVLLSDEPNLGPEAVSEVYRPLNDNAKELIIGTKRFMKNQYCFHLMAKNPEWDPRNVGTREQGDADTNRVSFLAVETPPEPIEREIIRKYCQTLDGWDIPEEKVDLLIKIAGDIREMSHQRTYPGTWELRQQIKVARKLRWYPVVEAYKIAALNNVEPETASVVLKMIATHAGEKLPDDGNSSSPF